MSSLKETFNKEMIATTYNLTDDKREYLSPTSHPDLSVLHAIRMSCTFPFLFEPYKYEDKLYLDGGIVDNFPIEYEMDDENLSIGINTTMNYKRKYSYELGYLDLIYKIFHVFMSTINDDKMKRAKNCDIIKIDTDLNFFNFDSTNTELIDMFDKGYSICKLFIEN